MSRNELADQNTKRPDVDSEVMTAVSQDFWRQVDRGPAVSKSSLVLLKLLGMAKIHELDVALALHRQHDVLWLQITVDNHIMM